jgi:hypothetical protein
MKRKLAGLVLTVVFAGALTGSAIAGAYCPPKPPPPEDGQCNSGRGNGPEGNPNSATFIPPSTGSSGTAPTDDCDPGQSGAVNSGGD